MIMASKTVVAIHQPNFFPWLGYFNKIARADIFAFMDNAQFPKTGGNWVNRVQLLVNQKPTWVTVPVVRSYHGTRRICEMEIDNRKPWRKKMLTFLQTNYGRAPFFKVVYPKLEILINYQTDSLAAYNINAIQALSQELDLDTSKFILGSTLAVKGSATELLIGMVKEVGGSTYLSGGGAGGYQDDDKFAITRLELSYQNFQHPIYSQYRSDNFVAGLSIIDALMNCGFQQTREMIS